MNWAEFMNEYIDLFFTFFTIIYLYLVFDNYCCWFSFQKWSKRRETVFLGKRTKLQLYPVFFFLPFLHSPITHPCFSSSLYFFTFLYSSAYLSVFVFYFFLLFCFCFRFYTVFLSTFWANNNNDKTTEMEKQRKYRAKVMDYLNFCRVKKREQKKNRKNCYFLKQKDRKFFFFSILKKEEERG